jgi:trehalose 6-phosphate phosphatase
MQLPPPPVPNPTRHALFLDFDGTLVGFSDDPEAVHVPAGLVATLDRLARVFGGALAIVSGREIASLDRLLTPLSLPAAGVHGLQMRRDGQIESNAAEAARLAAARTSIATAIGPGDPIRVEDKGGAIVLHYRGVPEAADRACAVAEAAAATDGGLVAVPGHAIVEVRPRAITKAGAILRFMERPPFAGRNPVFVGDDVTDEDGFRAAIEAGGHAVKVGPGKTAASYRLADVAAVRAWLRNCAGI